MFDLGEISNEVWPTRLYNRSQNVHKTHTLTCQTTCLKLPDCLVSHSNPGLYNKVACCRVFIFQAVFPGAHCSTDSIRETNLHFLSLPVLSDIVPGSAQPNPGCGSGSYSHVVAPSWCKFSTVNCFLEGIPLFCVLVPSTNVHEGNVTT